MDEEKKRRNRYELRKYKKDSVRGKEDGARVRKILVCVCLWKKERALRGRASEGGREQRDSDQGQEKEQQKERQKAAEAKARESR